MMEGLQDDVKQLAELKNELAKCTEDLKQDGLPHEEKRRLEKMIPLLKKEIEALEQRHKRILSS